LLVHSSKLKTKLHLAVDILPDGQNACEELKEARCVNHSKVEEESTLVIFEFVSMNGLVYILSNYAHISQWDYDVIDSVHNKVENRRTSLPNFWSLFPVNKNDESDRNSRKNGSNKEDLSLPHRVQRWAANKENYREGHTLRKEHLHVLANCINRVDTSNLSASGHLFRGRNFVSEATTNKQKENIGEEQTRSGSQFNPQPVVTRYHAVVLVSIRFIERP
jgi:hypothetical protein